MISNMIALKMIFDDQLVETKFISVLRTVDIQQDFLESFLGESGRKMVTIATQPKSNLFRPSEEF